MTVVHADPYVNQVPDGVPVDVVVDSDPHVVVELFRSRVLDAALR